jgi:hypothetical protein
MRKRNGVLPQSQSQRIGKALLGLLAGVYVVYLIGFAHVVYTTVAGSAGTIVEHQVSINASTALSYWTVANMRTATDEDQATSSPTNFTQASTDTNQGAAAKQQGQPSSNKNLAYPVSTVGKIFFTNSGLNMVCSGTAVVSSNQSVVDTAGHCLYYNRAWGQNVIFCPLYENGNTPYDCWAARDLEVPADWLNAGINDLHHDMGMAIVAPNDQGNLTQVVGGVGWAYNQSETQAFSAYGYPAASPFNGQIIKSCQGSSRTWQLAGGKVISIPCNMTGGSSGGPWFIQIDGNWYLNGHNDFTSTIQPGHMFSPYYDDTWYTLYNKAQHS